MTIHLGVYGEQSASDILTACGKWTSTWDKPLAYVWTFSDKVTCPECIAYATRSNDSVRVPMPVPTLLPPEPTPAQCAPLLRRLADSDDLPLLLTQVTRRMLRAAATALEETEQTRQRYSELILAVGNKYPGETRHQTALRYIRRAEQGGGPESAASGTPLVDRTGQQG